MLHLVPRSIFSWSFHVEDDSGRRIAEVDQSIWKERGELQIGNRSCRMYRVGIVHPTFTIEAGGAALATANKPSYWNRTLDVRIGNERFGLRPRKVIFRAFVLEDALGREVGSIAPKSPFRRSATIDLPQTVEPAVQVFLAWVVFIMWRRAAQNSS